MVEQADLGAFIEARLTEDEATARAAAGVRAAFGHWYADPWYDGTEERCDLNAGPGGWLTGQGALEVAVGEHAARHDPARVLRDVKAKRRTLARHAPHHHGACPTCWRVTERSSTREDFPCPTLLDLAAPYADHPGFRPEWEVVDG